MALIVAYDGGPWKGFARQPGQATVQAELERALEELLGAPVRVRGAGRTDAGVHAAGQVVDLALPARCSIPLERMPLALGAHLPPSIVCWSAHRVPAAFHARKSALSKRYRYRIWRGRVPSPFVSAFCHTYAGPLDVPAMRAAAAALVGRYDVSSFAGAARRVSDPVRSVLDCAVQERGLLLSLEVEADGFLYRMVRAIAGTLLEVGRGALAPERVGEVRAARLRGRAGPSLPAEGLCLLWVRYAAHWGLPSPTDPGAWPPPP